MISPRIDADIKPLDQTSPGSPEDLWKYYKRKEAILNRLKRGEKCYAAYVGGEIASYCWIAFGEVMVGEIQRLIRVRSDEVYLYDAYTLPKWRGYGLFSAVLAEILRNLKCHGYRRALIFALGDNIPSRKAISKAGFKQFSSIAYLRILGARIKLTARGEDPF